MRHLDLSTLWHVLGNLIQVASPWKVEHEIFSDFRETGMQLIQPVRRHGLKVENLCITVARS